MNGVFFSRTMAVAGDVCLALARHKTLLLRELRDTNLLDVLVKKGLVNVSDHELITGAPECEKGDIFIGVVGKQSGTNLSDLCFVIEKECPKLAKEIFNDRIMTNGFNAEHAKENMVLNHNLNRESPRSRRSVSQCSCASRRSSRASPPLPPLNNTVEMYVEPVVETPADRSAGWETHRVRLARVPGYGFGIAVSGGRDNPHFASGDPAIAVSDVLRGGPAEEKLQVNDRIASVNGVPLDNVEYARAVQVLRDSGAAVTLVVRRRAPAPPPTAPATIKLALTRNGKKEDFGVVLGCKLYVKELTLRAREQLNQAGQGLCEGDVVAKINNTSVTDAMTLKEARKLIESCKDRLNLTVTRELIREETVTNGNYQNNYNSLGGAGEAMSSAYGNSGQNLYVAAPVRGGAGERGERGEQPPRPPPPRNDAAEDYYSTRRQIYEEDAMLNQRNRPTSEPRLITFQKEGSVGLRLCGGNCSGVFVSGVQPGSPAAQQGLQPGDKILKVNDMEMAGVTREEAVLFLLSLQDRIALIVQHAPAEYQAALSGQTPGDSFHVKTHFHYTNPTDGETAFRSGDVFHVLDTLHSGTVGAWLVRRIGRNNQEVQKGTIPNKARAEELATAQFNATKKELSGSGDAKHHFFRRRRSTHRRSKSLGKEHWDEVVLSDAISKFPAYERVVLRPPAGVRPVVVLGALADVARERLLQRPEFAEPKLDNAAEESKSRPTSIIRLSSIRSIAERGQHALLDVTPSAIDRLNYAQFYPIVVFLKADSKQIIKQLRAGLPKSAHKSSKKLLEQCQQMERVWGHVFTHTVTLSEASQATWFSKLTELIQRTQQQQLWVSQTKRQEPLSDDFLFSMSSSTENRLSYASSPESDLEVSPPPAPRLVKSSSDPSIATTQDNMDRDDELNHMTMNDAVPPPYTVDRLQQPYDSKYGFSNGNSLGHSHGGAPAISHSHSHSQPAAHSHQPGQEYRPPPHSPLYGTGTMPELPPRTPGARPAGGVLLPAPPARPQHALRHHSTSGRPSAQERLFGPAKEDEPARPTSVVAPQPGSLDRARHANTSSYDASGYSYAPLSARLGPNAPDDLKATPGANQTRKLRSKFEPPAPGAPASPRHDGHSAHSSLEYRHSANVDQMYAHRSPEYRGPRAPGPPPPAAPAGPAHARGPSLPSALTEHAKFSRTNSVSQADYARAPAAPYKPVPPPKPRHYRPPDQRNGTEPPAPQSPRANGHAPYYPPPPHNYQHQQAAYGAQSPPYAGPPPHRGINLPHNPHLIDLAGSREQRGSAFELYRKPQHMHNMSSDALNSSSERDNTISPKTKKKLSKKPSFIKNAVLDLFRSKAKKLSRQQSLCEADLQQRNAQMPMLRREKSDLSDIHTRNMHIRNQMLHRSNSSCEKPMLRPILKRQSSFCDDRSGTVCTIRDYDTKPVTQNLRRQNSMCEIETEPKVTPLLRRQNSMIEYNRRGIYGQNGQNFNMITKIDPTYQRQQMQRGQFNPTQPLPPEPLYQSNADHIIYDPIPKPRRTYTSSLYDTSLDSSYTSNYRCDGNNESFESNYAQGSAMRPEPTYASRRECSRENPYATRAEVAAESPYATKQEVRRSESLYSESPYSSKEQMLRQRMVSESPYATKEEMLRQRFSESPYSTKDEMSKQRIDSSCSKESIYGKRTYPPPSTSSMSESPYGVVADRRLQTPVNFPVGRVSPMSKCMSEPPYASKSEMMARLHQTESPYATRSECRSSCSDSGCNDRSQGKRPSSAECTYVSKQEILTQKAALQASRESSYGMRLEEKLELIKQRNQAKKDMIYQTRKEANESDAVKIREPLYVSKRELKESVIYESHHETKEGAQIPEEKSPDNSAENSERNSPYELSDANHLSRRDPTTNSSKDSSPSSLDNEVFREIDFSKLRLTESKTDAEKEKSLKMESSILKGEPLYAPRLHGKAEHISNHIKITSTTVPYESTSSMETHYASECSMNFENKPQSTPYTSQDLDERVKPNRTVTFCEAINENSDEISQDNTSNLTSSQNETTVVNNQNTVIEASALPENQNEENAGTVTPVTDVQPDGPHTTWGIFDSEGGVLEDRQWGVSLIIPPKAIAPGIKQKIYFTVSDPRLSQRVGGPPIDMDNGEAMLSPLVMCGPQGLVFLRPVTLRLPHCANAVPSLGLTIKATDTEAHLSTDWDQIHLPATTTLNTVAVKVDHF